MIEAQGNRGSWFAKVDGDPIPCVHEHWMKDRVYNDPGCMLKTGKWTRFIAAIRDSKTVLLTRSKVTPAPGSKSGVSLARKSYLGVYAVSEVEADDLSLRFKLGNRIK